MMAVCTGDGSMNPIYHPVNTFNPCAGSSNARSACWGSCWTCCSHTRCAGRARSIAGTTVELYEFNALDLNSRASYLWEHGALITEAVDAKGRSLFYSMHGYFVEVEYDAGTNAITAVVPFRKGHRHERMVSAIDLTRLT